MEAYATDSWDNFFVAIAGAAAALAGLFFVGLSLNLKEVLRYPALPGRAAETIALLSNLVVLSTFGLVPGQTRTAVGIELLLCGVVAWLFTVLIQYRSRHVLARARNTVYRLLACQAATVPLVVAGASMVAGVGGGLYWLVPAVILSFLTAVLNAWVFLVEIER